MRVAIFTDHDFATVSGVTTTLRAVLRHAPSDVAPRIYTEAQRAADEPGYVALRAPGLGLPWYREMRIHWPRIGVLADRIAADGIRVIHLTTPGPVGLAGRIIAQRCGLPLVGSYHTHFGEYVHALSGSRLLGLGLERYIRWLYGPCRRVFVPSDATRALLVSRGYRAERLARWSRGVDTGLFQPQRRSDEVRAGWRVTRSRPAVLYAGRLSRDKGLAVVGGIQDALRSHGVAHRLIFAGDGPMRRELERTCADAIFLGSIAPEAMATAMASADVLLCPSATDSLGNVVLEGLASGLPALVSDRGGPREIVRDGQSGFVCRSGDVADFAGRLCALLRDEALRASLSAAARTSVAGQSWSIALQPLVQAWRDAAAGAAAVPRRLDLTAGATASR